MCSLTSGAGLLARLNFEVLDESVERSSNFEAAWNCTGMESLDSSKDNRYEVYQGRTLAYRSFRSTVGL